MSPTSDPNPGRPRPARVAVAVTFFVNGFILATWASRIPAIKSNLGLSQAQLGLSLLAGAVGALLAMNVAGYLAARFGTRPIMTISGLCLCATLPLLALSPSIFLLVISLFLLGAANGSMDVSMNAQGVSVERRYGRPILTSFHGLYSSGGLAGALVGGLVASRSIGPVPHFLAVALAAAAVALTASAFLLPASADAGGSGTGIVIPSRAIITVGFVAFCVAIMEGAMADWSAVYLTGTAKTAAGVAALGFAAFSLMMAAFRLGGDRLALHFGPVLLVRLGFVVSGLGLALALLFPVAPVAIVGFGLVGAGSATIFPTAMSAAGRIGGPVAGQAIAAAATCGYFGFLVGPTLIGFVAQLTSLRLSLSILVLLSILGIVLSSSVGAHGEIPKPNEGPLTTSGSIPL
jgi:MFS family permease